MLSARGENLMSLQETEQIGHVGVDPLKHNILYAGYEKTKIFNSLPYAFQTGCMTILTNWYFLAFGYTWTYWTKDFLSQPLFDVL